MDKKRGRPVDAMTRYRMFAHKVGGHVYAATRHSVVDEKSGKKKQKCMHWGKIDDENVFHPNKSFEYLTPDEQRKFIFPDSWKMDQLSKLSSMRGPGRASYDGSTRIRFYGDIWLMEQIARKRKVYQNLVTAFDGNEEIVADILSVAMYLYLVKLPLSHMQAWQELGRFPAQRTLSPKSVTILSQSITQENIDCFFRLRRKQIPKNDLCAVDSTTRRSYGNCLARVTWGESKEGGKHLQTAEVIVYSLMQHEPIMYFTFPGNMSDKRVIPMILKELHGAGFKNIILITDRGYDCPRTLDACIARRQKLITAANLRNRIILREVRNLDTSGLPWDMEWIPDKNIYAKQLNCEKTVTARNNRSVTSDRLRLNLYFDPARRAEELLVFQRELYKQELDLTRLKENKNPLADGKLRKFNYFKVKRDPNTNVVLSYEADQKRISKNVNTFGFFVIVTHALDLSAAEALTSYGLRDEQEKYFAKLKGQIDGDTQRSWSELSAVGRRFIEFISLILVCHMSHVWSTSAELRKEFPYVFAMAEEMKRIQCIERSGQAMFIEPFLRKQALICQVFGVPVPKECSPIYESTDIQIV